MLVVALIAFSLIGCTNAAVLHSEDSNSEFEFLDFDDRTWILSSLHPDTALFEPQFVQNFFMNINVKPAGSVEKREIERKPKCYDEIEEVRYRHQLAMRIECKVFVPGGKEHNPDMPSKCALPFNYKTGEQHFRTHYSCKPFEKDIDYHVESLFPEECPGGGHWCHFWCPTEVDPETGFFDPAKHSFKQCHPRECEGVEKVCLSNTMRLCFFPFDFQSFDLQDPRPVKHRQCTNADSEAENGFWCPVSVSDEFNFDDCTPNNIIYSEKCDQTFSHCILEYGNELSEVPDIYEDMYQNFAQE